MFVNLLPIRILALLMPIKYRYHIAPYRRLRRRQTVSKDEEKSHTYTYIYIRPV